LRWAVGRGDIDRSHVIDYKQNGGRTFTKVGKLEERKGEPYLVKQSGKLLIICEISTPRERIGNGRGQVAS